MTKRTMYDAVLDHVRPPMPVDAARDALVTAALDYEGAIGTFRHDDALTRFFAAVDAYRAASEGR